MNMTSAGRQKKLNSALRIWIRPDPIYVAGSDVCTLYRTFLKKNSKLQNIRSLNLFCIHKFFDIYKFFSLFILSFFIFEVFEENINIFLAGDVGSTGYMQGPGHALS